MQGKLPDFDCLKKSIRKTYL